jgi:hypothetical protein
MAKNKKRNKKKKSNSFIKLILFTVCIPAIFTIGPTMLFCFVGLLPTIVTAFVEKEDQYKWIAVGGMNLSGSFFFLYDLWFGPNSIDMALGMLVNPISIVVMYGCALIGVLFYTFFPKACHTVLQVAAYKRIGELQKKQKKLLDEWGQDLAKEVEAMERKMGPAKTENEIEALYMN